MKNTTNIQKHLVALSKSKDVPATSKVMLINYIEALRKSSVASRKKCTTIRFPRIYYGDSESITREATDNWYDARIEKPLIDIVKYLRNNGINTECCCGHKNYIQCNYYPDGEIQHLHRLLCLYFSMVLKQEPEFDIIMRHKVRGAGHYTSIDIELPTFKKLLPRKRKGLRGRRKR